MKLLHDRKDDLPMAETKDYIVQPLEGGNIMIAEDVVATIAALAVRDVDGVYGLSATPILDISSLLGKKNLKNGIRVKLNGDEMEISCNLVVKMGVAVMSVAKAVQDGIIEEVTSITGVRPTKVNINVCGIAVPKTTQK